MGQEIAHKNQENRTFCELSKQPGKVRFSCFFAVTFRDRFSAFHIRKTFCAIYFSKTKKLKKSQFFNISKVENPNMTTFCDLRILDLKIFLKISLRVTDQPGKGPGFFCFL